MTFLDLARGAAVFLDANILVYHSTSHPTLGPPCQDLLDRVRRGELSGYTTTHVLAEAAHRLMTLEALTALAIPFAGIANRLKRSPRDVQTLSVYRQQLKDLQPLNLQFLAVTPLLLDAAAGVSQQTGLLTNDALIVAVMRQYGLTNLASLDADFDRVPGLTRYAPV